MKKPHDDAKLKEELQKKAQSISNDDIEKLVSNPKRLEDKLSALPEKFQKVVKQVRLLFELVSDYWHGKYKKVPWYTISMVAAAILYVISPFDGIPDVIPFVGYIDDAFIVAFVWKGIEEDLKEYSKFKGYDLKDFF